MRLGELQDFLSQKGFKNYEKVSLGEIEGYPVIISQASNNNGVGQIIYSIEGNIPKDVLKPLRKLGYSGGGENYIIITFITKKKNMDEKYTKATTEVVRLLKESGIRPQTSCPVCNGKNCDSFALMGQSYQPVHARCVNKYQDTVKEMAEKNELSGNYITGFIGAVLGGIIGTIPSTLTIWFAERIYAVLFALIPLCAYYGYKLLRGKMNKVCIAITFVVSIAAVYFIEISLMVLYLVNTYQYSLSDSISDTILVLQQPGSFEAITKDSISSFVFVIIGIFITWGQIATTNRSLVTDAEEISKTISPNQNYVNDYAVGDETKDAYEMDKDA